MKSSPLRWFSFGVALVAAHAASAQVLTIKAEVMRQIDRLRDIAPEPDAAKLKALNQRMDEVWRYVNAHRAQALPVVRRELTLALEQPKADQFFLLDLAHLLVVMEGKPAGELAVRALARIDPASGIVQANRDELFKCMHALARLGATEVRGQIDRIYLPDPAELGIFQVTHVINFPARILCVFLYGVSGLDAEAHLVSLAEKDPAQRGRVLELLRWIGSEESVARVRPWLDEAKDYDVFVSCAKFLGELGGPSGRAALLAVAPERLEPKAREYFERIKPEVEAISAGVLAQKVQSFDGSRAKHVPDERMRAKMEQIIADDGVDVELSPSNTLNSRLPVTERMVLLKRIRMAILRRVDPHALQEVELCNVILQAMQFQK